MRAPSAFLYSTNPAGTLIQDGQHCLAGGGQRQTQPLGPGTSASGPRASWRPLGSAPLRCSPGTPRRASTLLSPDLCSQRLFIPSRHVRGDDGIALGVERHGAMPTTTRTSPCTSSCATMRRAKRKASNSRGDALKRRSTLTVRKRCSMRHSPCRRNLPRCPRRARCPLRPGARCSEC